MALCPSCYWTFETSLEQFTNQQLEKVLARQKQDEEEALKAAENNGTSATNVTETLTASVEETKNT